LNRLIVVLLALIAFATPAGTADPPPFISMIQLIANPEKYQGKLVAVVGFLHWETNRLYLSQEDFQHQLVENSICIERNTDMGKEKDKLNLKYVGVVGIFGACRPGMGSFSTGRIARIRSYLIWSREA